MITHLALAAVIYLTQEAPGADIVDNECNAVIEYHSDGEVTVHPTEACPGLTLAICLEDTTVIAEGRSLTVLGCSPDRRLLVVDPPAPSRAARTLMTALRRAFAFRGAR